MVSEQPEGTRSMSEEAVRIESLTNADYHGLNQVVGKSHLDAVAKSPAHYWARFLDPDRIKPEPTAAMLLGTAVHTAILEPHLWDQQYVVEPIGAPNRPTEKQLVQPARTGTKTHEAWLDACARRDWWLEFDQQAEGKTVISVDDADRIRRMADAVHKHPASAFLLDMPGKVEQTIRWKDHETGLECKCRPDWHSEDRRILVDVKTTEDASAEAFSRSCAKYRYHVQSNWYLRPFAEADVFLFIAVEKAPPYLVAVYAATPSMIAAGGRAADDNLRQIAACRATDTWPGYSDEIQPLDLPRWCND